mmetsp:Transcript_29537/g.55258  ORF Transcript_29537/g.55258 Transcript_29537/m.55258 type:complete len:249 (-) Transcript_29537:251-997(-)
MAPDRALLVSRWQIPATLTFAVGLAFASYSQRIELSRTLLIARGKNLLHERLRGGCQTEPQQYYYVSNHTTMGRDFNKLSRNKSVVVQENPVDQWHWSETDVTEWCEHTLKKRLTGLELIKTTGINISISRFRRMKGDATLLNRRGKRTAIWDLDVYLEWNGYVLGANGETVEGFGSYDIHLAHDDNGGEPQMKVSTLQETKEAQAMVKLLTMPQSPGTPVIYGVIECFLEELKEGSACFAALRNKTK